MNRKDQKPEPLAVSVLLVSDKIHEESTVGRAMRLLRDDLEAHNVTIVLSTTADDGRAAIVFDPHWDLHKDSGHRHAADLLRTLRAHNGHHTGLPTG